MTARGAFVVGAAVAIASTPAGAARAEEAVAPERFELSALGGYAASLGSDGSGNPFGLSIGARAGVFFFAGEPIALWVGLRCTRSAGSTTTAQARGYATAVVSSSTPMISYEIRTSHRVDDCTAEIGPAYRTASFAVRAYGAIGGALGSTCTTYDGVDANPNPECDTEGAGAIGLGATATVRIAGHVFVGLDGRLLSAGFASACLDSNPPSCSGGRESAAGVFADVGATF